MTTGGVVATIEARMTSSRLPGKVLMPAGGKPLLQVLIERLRLAKRIDRIIIATTSNREDDPVAALGEKLDVEVFRGSELDVLGRVCGALRQGSAKVCVEITGDCPLIDPEIVDEAISAYEETSSSSPYVSNSDPQRSVPAGLDVQVFSAEALYTLERETTDPDDREHVSLGFYRAGGERRWNPRFITHASSEGTEALLVTLDYLEDYTLIKALHEELSTRNPRYGVRDIAEWVRSHPELHDPCRRIRGIPV